MVRIGTVKATVHIQIGESEIIEVGTMELEVASKRGLATSIEGVSQKLTIDEEATARLLEHRITGLSIGTM